MTLLRKDYITGKITHDEYYGQFVTESAKHHVRYCIGIETLKASKDPHLNDIPLEKWDRLQMNSCISIGKLKEAEGCTLPPGKYLWSKCLNVCIAKATARALIKESN